MDDPGNLVCNGGFERGVNPPSADDCFVTLVEGSTDIECWIVSQDTVDWTHEQCFPDSGEGERVADLSSHRPAVDGTAEPTVQAIHQIISTVPGRLYHVWFDAAPGLDPNAGPRTLTVSAAGESEAFQFDSSTQADWRTRTWRFTAKEPTTTLTFEATSDPTTGVGVAIDNVIVLDPNAFGDQCTLRISAKPGGFVEVRSEDMETVYVADPNSETFTFECGADANLVAHTVAGYMFAGWTGLTPTDIVYGTADTNEVIVHVNHAIAVKAEFKNLVVTITKIETSSCPTIEATVMVEDIEGKFVPGLDWANFMVYEGWYSAGAHQRQATGPDCFRLVPRFQRKHGV